MVGKDEAKRHLRTLPGQGPCLSRPILAKPSQVCAISSQVTHLLSQFRFFRPNCDANRSLTAQNVAVQRFFSDLRRFTPRPGTFSCGPVDLGLSVKWSEFNLGATSPEEYGAYFSWGETSPKYEYNWENYKWAGSGEDIVTKYCPAGENDHWSGSGLCDDKNSLDMEDDAARVLLGGGWRIPSVAECEELLRECAISYQSRRGDWGDDILGWKVTGPNGNSIFLPAAGLRITYISDPDFQLHNELYNAEQTYGVYQTRDASYPPEPIFDWSASLKILIIDCGSFTQGAIGGNYRHSGIPIRPVL